MNNRSDILLQKLKAHGCRLTPQRMAIVRTLAANDDQHLTVEELFSQVRRDFPTTSLATVYKTLATLKEIGEVRELGFGAAGSRFDASRPHPHPHIICTRCGEILDPELADLERMSQQAAQQSGYQINDARLDFFGICPRCQGIDQTI